MRWVHEERNDAAHHEMTRTLAQLRTLFFWTDLKETVRNVVLNCDCV